MSISHETDPLTLAQPQAQAELEQPLCSACLVPPQSAFLWAPGHPIHWALLLLAPRFLL